MRQPVMWCLLGWWLAIASINAQAQGSEREYQRAQFLELEKAIQTAPASQLSHFDSAIAAISDYPLVAYLRRDQLLRQVSEENDQKISAFLTQYGNQPVARPLRKAWLYSLRERDQKQMFLTHYQAGLGTTLTCDYLRFQLAQTREPVFWLNQVSTLWIHGASRPKACDPLFRLWKRAGLMTIDTILARVEKVAKGGDRSLFGYLQRQLPPEYQYLVSLWRDTQRSAATVSQVSRFKGVSVKTEVRILEYGLTRLAWQKPEAAVKAYYQWQDKREFSARALRNIHRAIALSLAIDSHPLAPEWLAKANVPAAAKDVRHWHLAYMLRQQNWQGALAVIDSAPENEQQRAAFRYWQGRGYGELAAPEKQGQLLGKLAKERNYYGFLASARVKQEPEMAHQPADVAPEVTLYISSLPAAQRAFEWFSIGRLIDARREWNTVLSSLKGEQLRAAAVLASDWGWHDQAIIGFAKSGYLNDVTRRFPMAFASDITKEASQQHIDPAFAMAIARRESSFMVDAVSPAGARGLMQLMPSTVHFMQKEKVSNRALIDPQKNLQYGMQYLRYLMDKLDNNPVLVSASYNAGWKRVLQWLPTEQSMPLDIWIENIPYRETRQYVKAVLAYRYIYQWQMGQEPELFESLSRMQIKADNLTLLP